MSCGTLAGALLAWAGLPAVFWVLVFVAVADSVALAGGLAVGRCALLSAGSAAWAAGAAVAVVTQGGKSLGTARFALK